MHGLRHVAAVTVPALRCVAFDRRIITDIALPGAIADDGSAPPEVVIRRIAPVRSEVSERPILWRNGATVHFAPQGVAEYRVTSTAITVAPCQGADEDEIAALLIATALPGLIWLGGGFVLHAAAAILPGCDTVVAVAASSGTGKSTILGQLVERGARIVADDSVCLRQVSAAITASGLPGGYFEPHSNPAARPFVAIDPQLMVDRAPLGAILVLSRHASDMPATLRRLAPLEALTAILSHRHRPAIPALFGNLGEQLSDTVRIARIPTYLWSRPDGAPGLTPDEWHVMARLIGGGNDVGTAVAARR